MTMADDEDDNRSFEEQQEATAEELARMMRSQAGTVTQADIPPDLELFATMEAAWRDFVETYLHYKTDNLPPGAHEKIMEDAKFTFYSGIRVAANLCIFCAGQDKFEAAADQITAECMAYDAEEARKVQKKRAALDARPDNSGPAGPAGVSGPH
jgi:hypothetical protein